uniref:Ig-like domain-containing protein n=1 Tax=Equus asinus TaxID=9793 RepID=A0A9L0J0J3_EQUAS|nr:T-cell receptor alpha chain V region PY14 [Equus caballus]
MKPILISVLVMMFTLRGARAQTVTQPEESTSVIEGAPVQVKCNYSSSGSPYLFWYVQYPNQGPQLLLKHTSGESIKGFTANLNKGEKSFHLKKLSAQEEDSAMYYCALSDTVTGFTREAEHKPFRSYRKYFFVSSLFGHNGAFFL